MKREHLEKHLGKKVRITLFDRSTCYGELHKTGEEQFKNDPRLHIPADWYFCTKPCTNTFLFRNFHVLTLEPDDYDTKKTRKR